MLFRSKPIGAYIRKLREERNYSQQYVANCLDMSCNAYMKCENDSTWITLYQVSTLCELYQIDLSYFIETYLNN